MVDFTVKAFRGPGPGSVGPSFVVTFTPEGGDKAVWCTGFVANEKTAPLFADPDVFLFLLHVGQIHGGEPSDWLDKFLAQPDNEQLWETTAEGEFSAG